MNILQRLFTDLEFAPREHIVTVSFACVGVQPSSQHSIHEELWHLTKWQSFVLRMARGKAVRNDCTEAAFPDTPAPSNEEVWRVLVAEFLAGAEDAVSSAGGVKSLEVRLRDGSTVRERLELLAVHNAYHLGRIVLLRQLLGVWTPAGADA